MQRWTTIQPWTTMKPWTIEIIDQSEPQNGVILFGATILDDGDYVLGCGEGSSPELAVQAAANNMRTQATARREQREALEMEGK